MTAMKRMRRSTMAAIPIFVVASGLYVFVRPEDKPAVASSPIPVFVVTTTTTLETTLPDGGTTTVPTTETTLPSADGLMIEGQPTSETSVPNELDTTLQGPAITTAASTTTGADSDTTISTTVVTTGTTTG
ncbi:MAG: hypothetical protein ACI8TP_003978 [Acidimicrobiales bacterium]